MTAATISAVVSEETVRQAMFLSGDEADRVWETLLDADHVEMTLAHLTAMMISVNGSLATKPAPTDGYSTDYEEWRRRALGFKRAVERRIPVARAALKAYNRARADDHTVTERERLRELATAVLAHQQATLDNDITPEAHDRALWDLLDTLTVPLYDGTATLRDLLTEGPWA